MLYFSLLEEWNKYLAEKLEERKSSGILRSLSVNEGKIDFCSNDYLGFATSYANKPETQNAKPETHQAKQGSTGSRLISGNSPLAEQTEEELAAFHFTESALLFTSGYAANTGLFSCMGDKETLIVYDELVHASIRDGIRLSFAKAYSFAHNEVTGLEKKLQLHPGKKIIAVESVYSMDGDFAPLPEIAALAEKHNAALIVDEAHATGIFGEEGRGRVNELKLEKKVFARIITFGKAWGLHGAAVLGNRDLKNYLVNFARPFIYTTALPESAVMAISKTAAKIAGANEERKKLMSLVRYFRSKIKPGSGFIDSLSPIQCWVAGGNEGVKRMTSGIMQAGINVKAILSPTVKKGSERLRICLHSFNTEKEIDLLFSVMNK